MLADYVESEETQSSSAEVPLDKGDLGRQRFLQKAVRQGADVLSGFSVPPRTIFHQNHWITAAMPLKNLDSWGSGATFSVGLNHSFSTYGVYLSGTSSMRRNRDATLRHPEPQLG